MLTTILGDKRSVIKVLGDFLGASRIAWQQDVPPDVARLEVDVILQVVAHADRPTSESSIRLWCSARRLTRRILAEWV